MGGSEQRLADMIAAFDGPEVEHYVVVGGMSSTAAIEGRLGACRFKIEPSLRREVDPRNDPLALIRLTRTIAAVRPDVVHTCQSKAGILGRLAAAANRVPLVVHSLSMANFGEGFGRLGGAFKAAERCLSTVTDSYFVVGRDLRSRYLDAGIGEAASYHVVRSSLPVQAVSATAEVEATVLRRKFGLPADRPLILYVGSFDERKGVRALPRLLQRVQAEVSETMLVMAGRGPLKEAVLAELRLLGLISRAVDLDYVDKVPQLLAACDCVVLMSSAEGLSQVLVQAAGLGIPIVAYEVDGLEELLGAGADGRAIGQGRVDDMAAAVTGYLSGDRRIENRARRLDISEWSPPAVKRRYRSLVGELLEKDRR